MVGRPLPFVERIELRRDPELVPAFIKFMQGYYDETSPIIRESFDRIGAATARSPPTWRRSACSSEKSVTAGVYYVGFNMDDPVVGAAAGERGRALRQAMSLAIDAEEFLRLFTNGRGIAGPVAAAARHLRLRPGYREPLAAARPGARRRSGSPTPATRTASTRPPAGRCASPSTSTTPRPARCSSSSSSSSRGSASASTSTSRATDYNQFQDKVRRGAYQLFYWGWIADYPDPENFLFLLYGPMGRRQSGGPNTANFADPRYDELFVRMRAMENGPERLAVIDEMRAILERERPWIELFHPEDYGVHHGWLANVKTSSLDLPAMKYWDLSPDQRAEHAQKPGTARSSGPRGRCSRWWRSRSCRASGDGGEIDDTTR